MSKIISVSRRTDIPAFYGKWFMNRLNEGFAGYVNPYGGQKYLISLKPEDVLCFVFWSKNYAPFLDKLKTIEAMGYRFYFNYTITGLSHIFERRVNQLEYALDTLKRLSDSYSPTHINWRYDPILISNITPYDFHLKTFETIASKLDGYVERCYFSYAVQYGKVKRHFSQLQSDSDITVLEPDVKFKVKLANQLADIAESYGITMHTCCGDFFINSKIKKAHCIDGDIIEKLLFREGLKYKKKPTRKECGCTESSDIGAYDCCPHGCVYCYANTQDILKKHAIKTAFLGVSKALSDEWIAQIKLNQVAEKQSDRKIIQQSLLSLI